MEFEIILVNNKDNTSQNVTVKYGTTIGHLKLLLGNTCLSIKNKHNKILPNQLPLRGPAIFNLDSI